MRITRWVSLILLIGALAPAACGLTSVLAQGKPRVVATYSMVGELVRNVGGDRVDPLTLVGPDRDTERYEPTPRDVNVIASANLILEIGLGSEPWLDRLYTSANTAAPRVQIWNGIDLIQGGEGGEEGLDPHIFHDVSNYIQMTYNVRDALSSFDPANADFYAQNADTYAAQLRQLDDWVFAQVAPLAPERRKLVTSHDSFGYFARRYGFEIAGVGLDSFFTDAQPSANRIARLVSAIRAEGVPAVFVENVTDPRLMQTIAKEAGVTVGPSLYTDALGGPGSPGDTYISMMTYNVTSIVSALAG